MRGWTTVLLGVVWLAGCPRTPPGYDDTGDTGDTGDTADTNDTADTSDTSDTADTSDTGTGPDFVRVVTWNVQTVGDPTSLEYSTARAVLARLDADVVAINEVENNTDADHLRDLAQELGYTTVTVPSWNPYGELRNAIITRLPVVSEDYPDSTDLSGDSQADDLTRLPIVVTVDLPQSDQDLTVVSQHWKSGFYDDDEFRRAIDSYRTAQAAEQAGPDTHWVLVMGDVNAETDEVPHSPAVFTSFPSGLPGGYYLGNDLYTLMTTGSGIQNNAFAPLADAGLTIAAAPQQDGSEATRPISGRHLDYVLYSDPVPDTWRAETFDCADEALGGLPKSGDPVAVDACRQASDHLPVVFDILFQ